MTLNNGSWFKCDYCGGLKGNGTNHAYCSQQLKKKGSPRKPSHNKLSKASMDYLSKLGNK
jgi:hypothetical protein